MIAQITAKRQTLARSPSPLVTWFRCFRCHAGYFAAGAPSPQVCPACTGGRLLPLTLWDLRNQAVPPGMIRVPANIAHK
jgi:hypothetical protein